MQNFATPGPVAVVLDIPAGAVRLIATERTDAVVEVQPADASKKRDAKAAEQTAVSIDEASGAVLKVHTGEVTIARLTGSARIRNGKGDITVAEAHAGRVELRTDMGNLSVTAAPGVSATPVADTTAGRIANTLRNSEGAAAGLAIKATTSHGDITAANL